MEPNSAISGSAHRAAKSPASHNKTPSWASTISRAEPASYHRAHLSAPSRPRSQRNSSKMSPSRPARLAVAMTSTPRRQTTRKPSESVPVPRSLPRAWELSRNTNDIQSAKKGSSEPTSRAFNSGPPILVSATTSSATSQYPDPASAPTPPISRRKGKTKDGIGYASTRGTAPFVQIKTPRQPRQARVNAPPLVWGRRPPRPPKPPSPSPQELYHNASTHFLIFLCEWAGCKAELHNLDTLRRHVHIVHGRHRDKIPCVCRWGSCEENSFSNAQDWRAHLERAHLAPFQWHVGDGPRNTSDGLSLSEGEGLCALPDYLRGPDGEQVTPSIRDQELEDYVTWRMNRRRLKDMLLQRDRNAPGSSEEESEDSESL
ncbi:hypothetical protein E4U14_008533 [Claviceps sp. LM454 group G7]|nr:hypothetical protein E4U14_008533 [Claviceps sp. LM454 group G7]